MDRQIVCFAIPTFPIALARRIDSTLQKRPVVVALSRTPRSLITEASREALAEGVSVGLSVLQARRLCPALHVLTPNPARLVQADHMIRHVVSRFAPVWEPVAPGHFFLDLTGTSRLFGPGRDTAMRIEQEVARSQGFAGVAGIGGNKLVSRIASTLLDPMQLWDVRCGSEEHFLAPLPVQALPLDAASIKVVTHLLADLNIHTLGELASVDLLSLQCVLGRHASRLHAWARGIDGSPVLPPAETPSVKAMAACDSDDIDHDRLAGRLHDLLEQVCGTLRQRQRVCRRLSLSVETRDAEHVRVSRAVNPPTVWESDLTPVMRRLFRQIIRRRIRLRTLTVSAEDLMPVMEQLPLFPDPSQSGVRQRRLALALDHIRRRFGRNAIEWGHTDAVLRPSSRAF